MKKAVCILLSVIMILSLNACGTKELIDNIIETEPTTSNTVRITFPEGYTVTQVAERLEKNGVCSFDSFINSVNLVDPEYSEYGYIHAIDNAEARAYLLEGYIFPDTYEFYRNEDAATVLARFLKNTASKLDGLSAEAEKIGYSLDEIIIIASIIQKEAGIESEMNRVSSVIHNRLNSSYNKLECDVTINYLKTYVIPYLDGDTERYDGLYNTYKCFGLPAGPICNPGMAAIKAALEPENTDYMFFVTDKENPSVFYYAKTYSEHLENCKKAGW